MLSSPGLDSLLSSCRIEDKSNLIKEVIKTDYEKVLYIIKLLFSIFFNKILYKNLLVKPIFIY